MNLRSLRHVVVLARKLNYTRAAQSLHMTQSALSRSIQATEMKSNLRLFDRDRGGVHLTSAGRDFVMRAESILREMDDFTQSVEQMAQGVAGRIDFGMAPLPARAILPSMLAGELAEYPELEGQVVIRNAHALLKLLVDEEIDFFFCAEEQMPANAPVKIRTMGSFPLSLVVRAGHPLLNAEDEKKGYYYPVVSAATFRDGRNFPPYIAQHVKTAPQMVIEDYSILAELTAQSNALWPTSTCAISREITNGTLVELSPPTRENIFFFDINMYSLERRTLSPAAEKLISKFQARIQDLTKIHRND